MKVFSPFLNGNTTTSGSFNVPNHPSTASIQNPLTGSLFHDDTDGILKIYTGNAWETVGAQTAPSSGPASANIEYLVIAGGGGGGAGYSTSTIGGGGGGGAGGLLSSSLSSITSGSSITVSVGGGGTGQAIGSGNSTVGTDSSITSAAGTPFSTVTSNGGGRGGSYANTATGGNGGSGGGSAYNNAAAGSGTVGQGNDGGRETTSSPGYGNGGGGGASQAGSDGTGNAGGDGGDGKQSNITGTATYYAGGGGGGIGDGDDGDGGAGGNGGGGTGGEENISGTAGTSNTGGGGGGGGNDGVGGSAVSSAGATGGSGGVIFAYDNGSIGAGGGIIGDAGNGRKYHQFNESGTFNVSSNTDFQIITDSLEVHLDAGHFSSRGTSTWTDLTGNGYNATAVNSPTLNNYDYTFNGTTQEFSINISGITWGSAATLEAWVKFDVATPPNGAQTGIWTFDGSGNTSISHYPYSNGYGYFSTFRNTRVGPITLDSSVTLTDWHHVVITSTSGGNWIFYQNTSVTHTTPADQSTINTGVTNYIGRSISGTGVAQDRRIDGNIGQFRLYSKALSASEVLQNYNATKTNFV